MTIESHLAGLDEIVAGNYFFRVPIYQRLYVWGEEQVRTLLADLLAACQAGQAIYYLGGTLLVEHPEKPDDERHFDLIDGQQRFTTLWMLSLVYRGALQGFAWHQDGEDTAPRPRIRFPIRPEVDAFFAGWIGTGKPDLPCDACILDALALIESCCKEQTAGITPDRFADFVLNRVKLILTVVPRQTDLNKLFEIINSRGIQLQHHEILKARILQAIADPATRRAHARLWDACAYMNDYVERNLHRHTKIKITDLFDNEAAKTDTEDLAFADRVLTALPGQGEGNRQHQATGLQQILEQGALGGHADYNEKDVHSEGTGEVRSIVSFPMLLQHTLRIWLHQQGKPDLERILDKELLDLFGRHFLPELKEENARSFVRLLWEIRYLFDKRVIKWVRVAEQEQHQIHRLVRRTQERATSLEREPGVENSGFALLQSMLYHSQEITTHYWLTPFLAWMHCHRGDVEEHYRYLRHLDNRLLCSTESADLVKRSQGFLEEPWRFPQLDDLTALREPQGLGFRHYWFYKLEFVLWYRRRKTDSRWDTFRFTAKNSIEHVSPQNPQQTDTNQVRSMLNHFGNLVLVSRSTNSTYSNLPFTEKRERFRNRNASQLDSLKSDCIYACVNWNDNEAQRHQDEMIGILKKYLADSP